MKSQYLLLAESILYKNNKLTCINIFDQFVAVHLPAEFVFDLAVICGPGWEPGIYNVEINVKTNDSDISNIGNIDVTINSDTFVYNAIANNLKIAIGPNVKNITFVVYKNGESILERSYPVGSLLVEVDENQIQQEQPQKQEK